ncbi:hypothetical protein M431DRAFT_382026 [Trichoderma harzianum CBS 226.95]|uniref:Uncharacterized protein n=1 Tax=Trichoderma harzianum CBS 226.95 TaxID=983964 RepID=A0A2T4AHL4_TRIHA|nr:hypothetical protein M431DRAFT_382026 [Trichoderma harzianum CBS 226.95]PTB56584.1 hypothetical protein M431DRAFT_382026 [Trichoderma harzianum CBS 226.95]
MPSQPGETPGPKRDGRRLFPRQDPSSSKGLCFLLAAHQANQGGQGRHAEPSRRFTGLQLLSKSLVDKGRIMADPKETPFACGDATSTHATAPIILVDSFSLSRSTVASEPTSTEAKVDCDWFWLGRRHIPPAMSAQFQLALWKWRKGKRKEKESCHSLRAFVVGTFDSSLTSK